MKFKGTTQSNYLISIHEKGQPDFAMINISDNMTSEEIGDWVLKQIIRQENLIGRDG